MSSTAAPDAGLTLVAGNPATVQIIYPIDATGYTAVWTYGVYNLDGTRGTVLATKTLANGGLQYVLAAGVPSFYLTLTGADTAGQAPGAYWTHFEVYAPGGALDGVTDDVLTLTAAVGAAPGAVVGGQDPTTFGSAFALTADTNVITADGGVVGSPEPSFNTLQTRVLDYLDRPELPTQFPWWVQAWQAKLNRVLRVAGLEALASLVPSPITGGCALPNDYQAWRTVQTGYSGRNSDLEYATPDVILHRVPYTAGGLPRLFTIKGQMLFPVPAGPVTLTYYRGVPPYLSGVFNDWVLLNHYDIYLYGVLSEAETYLKNDERAAMWEAKAATAMNDLIYADRDARWGRARVMMTGATP